MNGPILDALREYRRLLEEHGPTWGEDPIVYVREIEVSAYLMGLRDFRSTLRNLQAQLGDPDGAEIVRAVLGGRVLDNLAVLRLTPDGVTLDARPQAVLENDTFHTTLLLDSSRDTTATVTANGVQHQLSPRTARLIKVASTTFLSVDGMPVDLRPLTRPTQSATLLLRAGFPCRWSVMGEDGQGWYPDGVPHRVDAHRTPYFHGDDLLLRVPAEPLTVRVTRGMEYATEECTVTPDAVVELTPKRLYDAAARGWYGGDMHVHLNWTGDTVATPDQAAAVQHGEDLHVLNLVAGNVASERVYDREALEHWAGKDLDWSDETHVARFGVEYRNDLLGHLYAFGVREPPTRYHTGFRGTPDWPPNAQAITELRDLGAITGYSHPFHAPGATPEEVLAAERNCSAREIVVDAALGLIDSLDVLNHSSVHATAAMYRRLIGAGNVLAVTAGTDSMLSFTRRGNQSSPPGWERVYAQVEGKLTAASYAEAIRKGRTFATTGPWLELDVDGLTPGDVLDTTPGDRVKVTVRCIGEEVTTLQIRTAERVVAQGPPPELTTRITLTNPTYIVAIAQGPNHPRSMHHEGAYAHTSPVYIDLNGTQVAHTPDLHWCLNYLDSLETFIKTHATLNTTTHQKDHLNLLTKAHKIYKSRIPP